MYPREPYFRNALHSVRAEKHLVDEDIARELIERIYAIRHGQTGQDFRTLFDRVIEQLNIPENDRRGYQLVIGRYFNQRAVRALRQDSCARRKRWIPAVLSADAYHVRFQVYPELRVTFRPTRGSPIKLFGKHISITEREVLSGSSHIGASTYAALVRQALAILNEKRGLQVVG